ncbi:MAG: hypothetical protein ACOY94_20710 [Bacillota bacterium]
MANQIVWQALIGTYDKDDDILPLSYRLRPVVEANLRVGFAAMDDPETPARPLQLLAVEQMEHVLSDTVLPLQPSYEQVRARLQEAFDELILGGVRLVPMLREISRKVHSEYGIRPALIVDDLVQSMNVYASDLLDYLITLEEGEWDVVIGLTPASFERDRRGRELLARIRELDTVDDRVIKLDLSDTTGDQSSFLEENSAVDLLLPYLDQYKQANGYTCNRSCPHWGRCGAMQWGQDADTRLGPFNRSFISRLWRNLPMGKGRVRYLLLAVKDILERMATQGPSVIEDLPNFVERDQYVSHANPRVRALLECYGPVEGHTVTVPADLGDLWRLELPGAIAVQPLVAEISSGVSCTPDTVDNSPNPALTAVRDWLEGATPNPELLKPLRIGTARFIKDMVDPTLLAGLGHAQRLGALRWSAVQGGVSLPVRLEAIDKGEGITLSREVGRLAFDLVAYGSSRGKAKGLLLQKLLAGKQLTELLYQAEAQRGSWQRNLEAQLGCGLREVAFHLYRVMIALGGGDAGHVPTCLEREAVLPEFVETTWPDGLTKSISALFRDCFLVREHLWDGHALFELLERYGTPDHSLARLKDVLGRSVCPEFRLSDQPLGLALGQYETHLLGLVGYMNAQESLWAERCAVAETCAALLDGRRRRGLTRRLDDLSASAQGRTLVPLFPVPPETLQLEQVRGVLQVLLDSGPTGIASKSLVERYRLLTFWARIEGNSWVSSVSRWRGELFRVLGHLRGSTEEMNPDSAISTLLEEIQLALAGTSPGASTAGNDLQHLLVLLTPKDFQIARHLQVSIPEGATRDLAQLVGSVLKACSWWEAFVMQLPLVHRPGRRIPLNRVREFLHSVRGLRVPDAGLLHVWGQFVHHMRHKRIFDLPVRGLAESPTLSPQVRDWLREASRGSRLLDLTPEVLSDLLENAPELAQVMRITMMPEEPDDGVLHLVDGQRS